MQNQNKPARGYFMERLDYRTIGQENWRALGNFAQTVENNCQSRSLIEIIKLHASQINGCANCVNLHANLLRKIGESEERIQNVIVWQEATCFSEREKSALAWTEAVTRVSETGVPDEIFERVSEQFTDLELSDLTFEICTINFHNRLAIAFRREPGS
ncbi:MAG: alkylhydroperoxidase [Rhodospirillaceae bacterium]|nr:alkylhydroperoxidase [Rhodospirillaceae bacterium]